MNFDDVAAAAGKLQDGGMPVTIDTVRDALGGGSASAISRHLADWRAAKDKPAEPPRAELPQNLVADLARWAQQFAEEAGSGTRAELARHEEELESLREAGDALEAERNALQAQRDELATARDDALATLAERDEEIERLNAELRNARQVAMEALVGKAKDQLAIEGKDAQLAELRAQIEKNVTQTAALSDARLAAEMELVGAKTARDSLEAENKDLRAQIAALRKR
ncbi:DNA-binding protein [Massilia sp. LXY-6]|uniref:DNA-binding protein n=1 Tax=Massilia sp. LXY-6 TaxID=3379823 RepID=UPI003EDF5F3E